MKFKRLQQAEKNIFSKRVLVIYGPCCAGKITLLNEY